MTIYFFYGFAYIWWGKTDDIVANRQHRDRCIQLICSGSRFAFAYTSEFKVIRIIPPAGYSKTQMLKRLSSVNETLFQISAKKSFFASKSTRPLSGNHTQMITQLCISFPGEGRMRRNDDATAIIVNICSRVDVIISLVRTCIAGVCFRL